MLLTFFQILQISKRPLFIQIITIQKHHKQKAKYIVIVCIPIFIMKKYSINFDNRNIDKKDFYKKNKKYLLKPISILIKYYSLKKNNMVNTIHLNTFLCIMIIMLLDHCVYLFRKQLDIMIYIKKKKKLTMTLMVKDKHFLENYKKIRRKIEKLIRTDFESRATYVDKYINT